MIKEITTHFKNYWITNIRKKIHLILFITGNCNLKCDHCFYATNKFKNELTKGEISNFLQEMKGKINAVDITGGEPFLRNDLSEIAEILCKNGIKDIAINTNGFLTDKIINFMKQTKLLDGNFTFMISIDGLEKTHDRIRGVKGSFKEALKTAKLLKQNGANVYVNTVINPINTNELTTLSEYLDKHVGIVHTFDVVRGVSQSGLPLTVRNTADPKNKKLLIDKNQIKKIHEIIIAISKKRYKTKKHGLLTLAGNLAIMDYRLKTIKEKKKVANCVAGRNVLVLYSNGDLAFCEMMVPVGNIRRNKVKSILASENSVIQKKVIQNCFCTHSCFVDYDSKLLYCFGILKKMIELKKHDKKD